MWWLTGCLRRERELCCDELAVSVTGRRAAYARALEFVARRRVPGVQPALAAGLGGKKMMLVDRVRHVLGVTKTDRRVGWWSAGMVALAIPLLFWAVSSNSGMAKADEEREGQRGEVRDSERGERERPEGDRPRERDEERREGDRPREGEREPRGDRDVGTASTPSESVSNGKRAARNC